MCCETTVLRMEALGGVLQVAARICHWACAVRQRQQEGSAAERTGLRSPTSACAPAPAPQEYFSKILKKLKEVGATADRTNFYV